MLFTDSAFLLRFLPPLLALFFIAVAVTPRSWREGARRFSLANAVLLAGSIVFLLGGAGAFIRLIAASVLFNYAVTLAIGWARRVSASSARPSSLPEALLTLVLTGNVVLLGVYKFAVPLGGDLDRFAERSFAVPQLLAPLGLTVITCHAISYGACCHTRTDIRVQISRDRRLCGPRVPAGHLDVGSKSAERHRVVGNPRTVVWWLYVHQWPECVCVARVRDAGDPCDGMGQTASSLGWSQPHRTRAAGGLCSWCFLHDPSCTDDDAPLIRRSMTAFPS